MAEPRPARSDTPPWWAEGGSERCPFCEQLYFYEVEVRCVDCDRPACPHCVCCERTEHLTTVVRRCPECAAAASGGGEG